MKTWFYSLLPLLWGLSLPVALKAQDTQPIAAPSSFSQASAVLDVAISANLPPLSYRDDNGEAAGILPELLKQAISQADADYILTWQFMDAIPEGVSAADSPVIRRDADHQPDIDLRQIPTSISAQVQSIAVPIDVDIRLYTHESIGANALTPYRIGMVAGFDLFHSLPSSVVANLVRYDSLERMLSAATAGDILAFITLAGATDGMAQFDPLPWQISVPGVVSPKIVISEHSPIAPVTLRRMLEAVDIAAVARSAEANTGTPVSLVIAAQTGIAPYADIGSDGQLHGLYVDLWRAWSEQTGVRVSFLPSTMQQSVKDVSLGVADVQIGYPQNEVPPDAEPESSSGLEAAWQIYGVTSRVFVPAGRRFSATGEGEIIGVFRTAPYQQALARQFPAADLVVFESPEQMLTAMEHDDLTAFVAATRWAESMLVSRGEWDKYRVLPQYAFDTRIDALISPHRPELKSLIAEGFASIPGNQLADLEAKWIYGPRDRFYVHQASQVPLSVPERLFLSQLGSVQVGYLADWAPFEFRRDAQMTGINADVMRLLAARLGLTLEFVPFDSFHQLLDALKRGDIKLVGSLLPTAERLKDISFTDSYWPSPWAVASTESSSIYGLAQLAGKRVVVVEGYHLAGELMLMRPRIELKMVSDVTEGLSRLAAGDADLMIGKLAPLAWEVQKRGDDIRLSMLTDVAAERSHIGVNNQYAALVPLLNRALAGVEEHEFRRIYEQWVPDIPAGNDIAPGNWLVAGICLLLVLGGWLWLRRRAFVADERRELLKDPITGLIGRQLLDDRLSQAVLLHQRQRQCFALIFITIEGMETLAAQLGAAKVESVFRRMTARLATGIRRSDTVARFSEYELVVLLPFVTSEEHLAQLAHNIQSLLTEGDEHIAPGMLRVGLGVALYPKDGGDPIELLAQAAKLTEQALASGVAIKVA
ncbi:transporter substrate-binding domain-containing protein [Shewanella sp. GXUN23E]|uniref:transporter substrate-binding domain-containing protein n=1 Tax=Shewanella sp. GXUN23E TaxID=3422498 RepID=UPI003D7CA965